MKASFFGLVSLICLSASAVPDSVMWPLWNVSDETGSETLDHSLWRQLLQKYVDNSHSSGINRFNYSGINTADRQQLVQYLDQLQSIDPRKYPNQVQKAYWINLYNALTVQVVLAHPKKKSILRMGNGFFSIGPWNDEVAEVNGKALTLNDIEHRIIRPIWKDHRVHFALNCASLGCPNLADFAYTRANLDVALSRAEKAYLNHARGATFVGKKLVLSSIFDWYSVDFADNEKGIIAYLAEHVDTEIASPLSRYTGRVKYEYNWDLNAP